MVKVTYMLNPGRFKNLQDFQRPCNILIEDVESESIAREVLAKKHKLEKDQIKLLKFE